MPETSTGAVIAIDHGAFGEVVGSDARIEKIAGGFGFVEGPTWTDDGGGYLLFSDIPNNRIHRWSADHGVSVFREPSGHTNGNTRDRGGQLLSCEHSGRRVAIEDRAGVRVTVIDHFLGNRLNSPNDVVV